MCKKELDSKVRECGSVYGMDIYSNHELLSLATSISPDILVGGFHEILDCPSMLKGIGRKKELAVLAVKELARRLMKEGTGVCCFLPLADAIGKRFPCHSKGKAVE